jgi:hypothetical protein
MFENSVNFDYVENYGNTQETDERKSFSFDFQAFGKHDNHGTYETLEFIINNTPALSAI